MNDLQRKIEEIYVSLDSQKRGYLLKEEILSAFNKMGIRLEDKRIFNFINQLRNSPERIKFEQFSNLAQIDQYLVLSILEKDLIIPDFEQFCHQIEEIYNRCLQDKSGIVANYIPNLAKVNPDLFGVSICTIDGQRFSIGDSTIPFSIQSTCKPINYAIALEEKGEEIVHKHVGREPSGRGFNVLQLNDQGLPHNPMINAGAIMCCSLIGSALSPAERIEKVINVWGDSSGGEKPFLDIGIFLSEKFTADRNFALAYHMRENKAFEEGIDLVEVLDFYFECCSLMTTTESMSVVAATLANMGVCPITGKEIFSPNTIKNTLSMMYSCGMYDFSGEFSFTIGIPAKSGVSGFIFSIIPNVMGIATVAPRLDRYGNSSRGILFCKELIKRFNFHNYDSLIRVQDKVDPRNKNSESKKLLNMMMRINQELYKISENLSIEEVLEKLVAIGISVIGCDRGSLFINDEIKNELYGFIQIEGEMREIRFPNNQGIAGTVFQSGKPALINDPYHDPRFNPEVDKKTGYHTKNILCDVIKTYDGKIVGVIELINRNIGGFTKDDLNLLQLLTLQTGATILYVDRIFRLKKKISCLEEQGSD